MIDALRELIEATRVRIPPEHHRPVAIVGAGAIVEAAHLPAYRTHGLPVVGVYDVDQHRAHRVANEFDLPSVYESLESLLADDDVEVVDIAVVPAAQPPIATAALKADKHLLCQKPLATTVDEAQRLVELARAHDRKLAVNQQLRYDEGIRAARVIIERGWIGTPTTISFTVNISTDFSAWGWLVSSAQLDLMYHSIHYFDAVRSLVGDPHTVFCTIGRTSGQVPAGETRSISTLVFAGDTRAIVQVQHENRTGDPSAEFRVDGPEGAIRGTLGLLYDYPHGRPDTLEFASRSLPTDGWVPYPVTTRWIPDAFAGPMGSLLHSVATGASPDPDGFDNLDTLRLVHALYRSAESGESVRLGEGGND